MVRVGILGCGGIARAHAEAYRQFEGRCRIVAVGDIFREQAERFAAGLGGGVEVHANPRGVLDRADVDLVSVCTPPFEHAPLTISALRAGKHVLVEKPMATSVLECDRMVEAARAAGRTLSVVHQNRFRPDYARLKALVEGGALGTVDFVAVHCLWWRGPEYYKLWWRGTWEKEGGGALLNHAVHAVDLMVWIAGMPESVHAMAATRAHDIEVDDLAAAVLRYPGGALGQFTGTVDVHLNRDSFEVCGRRAAVAIPWRVGAMVDTGNGFGRADDAVVAEVEREAAAVPVSSHQGHAAQVERLLDALEGGEGAPVTGEDGRRAVEVITAMYASAADGAPCALPLRADHPMYGPEGLRARMRGALARRGGA